MEPKEDVPGPTQRQSTAEERVLPQSKQSGRLKSKLIISLTANCLEQYQGTLSITINCVREEPLDYLIIIVFICID